MVGGGGSNDEYDGDGRQQQQRGQGGGSSRWNPTKEQIRLLEGMYSRGLRTPSAEQIQHITRTLNKHGHIQGKNVFYWFQNHKARQRQKHHKHNQHHYQHQLHINNNYFPYFNHHYPPPFPPFFPPPQPTAPVVGSPCHIPNEHLGFYHQFPKVQPPPAQESVNETTDLMQATTQWYNQSMPGYPTSQYQQQTFHLNSPTQDSWMRHPQQTLDLFPMHPTGILQTRNYIEIHDEEEDKSRPNAVPNTHTCSNNNCGTDDHDHYAFFDFLCRE